MEPTAPPPTPPARPSAAVPTATPTGPPSGPPTGPPGGPVVLAVCRVHALLEDAGTEGVTAIDKRPVDVPVRVYPMGLRGDVQVSRQHHGGLDKAVYAYAQEAADAWSAELGREVEPGLFGENLRTAGVDVDGALFGERWRLGTGDDAVLVEVTMPRTPCQTFARRMGEPRWVRRFTERGLAGAYLRVLDGGTLRAGDPVEVVHRPAHGVSLERWSRERSPRDAQALLGAHDAREVDLCEGVLTRARAAARVRV